MIRTNDPYLAEKNKNILHQVFEGILGTRNLEILCGRLVPIARCAGFTREESLDIFSETLLSMFKRGIQGYNGELTEGALVDDPCFSRYMYGVFVHHMIDYNDRKKIRPDIASVELQPCEFEDHYNVFDDLGLKCKMELQPDQQAILNETWDITSRALSYLDGIEAAILKMRFWEGLNLKEIAKRFELHPIAIRRVYLSALSKLRGYFPEDYNYGLKLSR